MWHLIIHHGQLGDSCKPALYNLETDPSETTDLQDKYPDIFNTLINDMNQWLASVNNSQYTESMCAINKTDMIN